MTRDRILKAAEDLFSEKGFHSTNSKEIAARACVSIGSFYSYFKDKKNVFFEVLDRYDRRVMERITLAPSGKRPSRISGRNVLNHLLRTALKAHDLSPQFHREATAMRYSDPDVELFFDRQDRKMIERIEFFFKRFENELRIKDKKAAALVIHKAMEEIIHSIKIFGAKIPERRLLRELEDMISRYLFI